MGTMTSLWQAGGWAAETRDYYAGYINVPGYFPLFPGPYSQAIYNCIVTMWSMILGVVACGLGLAQANEALQPCGDAFYYPSKVRSPFNYVIGE